MTNRNFFTDPKTELGLFTPKRNTNVKTILRPELRWILYIGYSRILDEILINVVQKYRVPSDISLVEFTNAVLLK